VKKPDTIARREAEATRLLKRVEEWEPLIGPTGVRFYRIPGSKGAVYTVSPRSCTCPDSEFPRPNRAPGPCKHIIAVLTFAAFIRAYRGHLARLYAIPAALAATTSEEDHREHRDAAAPGPAHRRIVELAGAGY
jgi:hypothetical protein